MTAMWFVSATSHLPVDVGSSDKILHAAAYAVLAALAFRAAGGSGGTRAALVAVLVAAAYGALDEYHQSFVPGRTASAADWLADACGAAIGAASCLAWTRRTTRARGER